MANIKTGRKISLPIWKESAGIPIELRQGNINSIFLTVDFLGVDGLAVTLPAGANPRMEFLKPDKTILMVDGVIDPADPNAFIIELSAQCFAVAGQAIADFKVADTAGNVLVGAQLTLQIGDSAVNPAAVTSVSEFVTLQNALSDVAYADEISQQAIIRANAAMKLIEPSTQAAAASERAAKLSETNAKASEMNAATSATAAGQSKTAAEPSAGKALVSETNADASERAAKLSETNAKASETGAATSATAAGQSKTAAEASAVKAFVSETNAAAAATRAETLANQMDGVGVHRYGILWDGVNAACTRMYNAVGMVAAAHLGTFNPALKNDFDRVYPWCDMKLCNWVAGTATEKAKITAFEGEPDFDLTANIGAYRPEFWYKVEQQPDGGILKVVADGKLPGYIYNPAYMATAFCEGKDAAGKVTCKIGDTQAYSISLNDYNTLNAANGMLTEDYRRDGAEKLLMEVEFATMNSQNATGQGFTCARYADDRPAFAETAANRVIFTKDVAEQYVAKKQTIGIARLWFGDFKAYFRKVLSVTPHTDPLYSCVNFDGEPVNIETTDHVGSMCAVYDNAV
ncbi:MAG: BppU family phage baseplate upper protein, partial [Ruthenibacterium sp.]